MSIQQYWKDVRTKADRDKRLELYKKDRHKYKPDGYRVFWRANGKNQSQLFPSHAEAKAFEAKLEKAKDKGMLPATASKITFGEMCERFKKEKQRLSERSVKSLTYHLDKVNGCKSEKMSCYGKLRDIKVNQITNAHINDLEKWLHKHCGYNNSKRMLSTVRQVFKWGRDHNLTIFTPARSKIQSKTDTDKERDKKRHVIPEAQEIKQLIKHAEPVLSGVVCMLSEAGLRIGECLALQWKHIHLDKGLIIIEQTTRLKPIKIDGAWSYVKPPKTEAANRPLAILSDDLYDMLEDMQQRAMDNDIYKPEAFVFTYNRYNTVKKVEGCYVPIDATNLHRPFTAVQDKLDFHTRYTFHQLRHYYASNCILQGVPITKVSENLGHANATMTLNVYAHVIRSQKAEQEAERAMKRRAERKHKHDSAKKVTQKMIEKVVSV